MGYTPNIPHLYNPSTNHLLTSWNIQVMGNHLVNEKRAPGCLDCIPMHVPHLPVPYVFGILDMAVALL